MKNGRPDSGYLYWRWKPQSCELPPFDARRFLELMRNKSLALIGDSISQNHVQSILCMLAVVCMLINLNFMGQKIIKWNYFWVNILIARKYFTTLLNALVHSIYLFAPTVNILSIFPVKLVKMIILSIMFIFNTESSSKYRFIIEINSISNP